MSAQVSIIIPVHNGAALLERCLDAITWATPAPLELIVVDDASTDGSGASLTLRPAEALDRSECHELLSTFFEADWHRRIFPHPRYRELFTRRVQRGRFGVGDGP